MPALKVPCQAHHDAIAVADALAIIRQASSHATHTFWPDNITITDNSIVDDAHLIYSGQVDATAQSAFVDG